MKRFAQYSGLILSLLLAATLVYAGGVDPREIPQEKVVREKVTATPAQTSAAVSKARRAVAPEVKETPTVRPQPQPRAVTSTRADKNSWLLSTASGSCEPLSAVSRQVKNIGTFTTPKEFARQMQQRGYQAFALDIGDVSDQVVRVKVPDLNVDLTFKKAGLCR